MNFWVKEAFFGFKTLSSSLEMLLLEHREAKQHISAFK